MSTDTPLEGWRPGHRIGSWVVDRVVDRAISGTVLLCHADATPHELVHVKICDLQDADARRRFAAEAALLLDLEHPSIVPIREAHLDENPPWLVLDPGRAEDLHTLLQRDGPPSLGRALRIAEQVAGALAFLHGQARYHRDLKPRSILVDGDRVRITDFGLAREEGAPHLTAPNVVLGTVDYTPPEWTEPGEERPAARDLYGLGVVLYELLTGRDAYEVAARHGTLDRAVQVIALKRTLDHLDPGEPVPEPVRQLVRDLTALEPSERPSTAREVRHRLTTLLGDLDAAELERTPRRRRPLPPSATPTVPPAGRVAEPPRTEATVAGQGWVVAAIAVGALSGGGLGALLLAAWWLLR